MVARQVLVNTSNIVNILYYDTFVKLGIEKDQLRQIITPLLEFMGNSVELEGSITLSVEIAPTQGCGRLIWSS